MYRHLAYVPFYFLFNCTVFLWIGAVDFGLLVHIVLCGGLRTNFIDFITNLSSFLFLISVTMLVDCVFWWVFGAQFVPHRFGLSLNVAYRIFDSNALNAGLCLHCLLRAYWHPCQLFDLCEMIILNYYWSIKIDDTFRIYLMHSYLETICDSNCLLCCLEISARRWACCLCFVVPCYL